MSAFKLIVPLVLAVLSHYAIAACDPIRVGYVDQERPPYYLGAGAAVPEPPGASVELMREIARSVGCTVTMVRLPILRIRPALEAGTIDAAPIEIQGNDIASFAFPLDKDGQVDREQSLRLSTVVFVRASDNVPRDAEPMRYFKGRTLGTVHGASYTRQLRDAGLTVDDGALDTQRNLEKVKLGRLDGYVVAITAPSDLDGYVAKHFGNTITRLETPLRSTNVFLAFNKDYRARNQEAVEAMWRWIGSRGRVRFTELLKSYEKSQ